MDPILAKLQAKAQASATAPKHVVAQASPRQVVALERLKKRAGSPALDDEMLRILSLPVLPQITQAEVDAYNREFVRPQYRGTFGLFPKQVAMIQAYRQHRGSLAFLGVGQGKTLASLMIAEHAHREIGHEKVLLLIPSEVFGQLWGRDIAWATERVYFTMQPHSLSKTRKSRLMVAQSQQPGLYVMPYSLLSQDDAEEILTQVAPTLVIADEAHNLKNLHTGRTKRFMAYVEAHTPDLVKMSGTLTKKRLADYYHLAKHALKDNCPLPLRTEEANDWALVLDAQSYLTETSLETVGPLMEWAAHQGEKITRDIEGARKAYRTRLYSCPGIIGSTDEDLDIGCSLLIQNHPAKAEPSAKLLDLINRVEELWLAPNGDEIDWAIHKHKWFFELSAGFYYDLRWPEVDEIPGPDAAGRLRAAKAHHQIKQEYAKLLRQFLKRYHEGLNTPFEVGQAIYFGTRTSNPSKEQKEKVRRLPRDLVQVWGEMKDAEFEDMPSRVREPVRVDDYKIQEGVRLAKAHRKAGIILWYYSEEIGKWLHEACLEAGVDALWCPSGKKGSEAILAEENRGRVVVASYKGHGTGKNLQHGWDRMAYVQWPRESDTAEQSIGRCHRTGQPSEQVTVHLMSSIDWDHKHLAACLNDSLYTDDTSNRQKLIYANWDPVPRIVEDTVLIEEGFDANRLSPEQKRKIRETFALG